jgi:hypothetical protein
MRRLHRRAPVGGDDTVSAGVFGLVKGTVDTFDDAFRISV